MQPCAVTRSIDLDASPDEVWQAITDADELGRWLADEAAFEALPGAPARFVEDGKVRRAVVEAVEDGRRLVFLWWDDEEGEAGASRVELTVVPVGGPTRLVVHETVLGAPTVARAAVIAAAASRWDVRIACLALQFALARV